MSYTYKKYSILLLIVLNISLQVSSFILVKYAALESESYIDIFFNLFYIAALFLTIISSVVWQKILKEKNLSEVYPFNAVVPLLLLVSGSLFFNEIISVNNIIGSFLVMIGIFMIVDTKKYNNA